ncbi:hypothetical protein SKAU_G00153720 [Synaphobranchus kaupii]|uniref:Uncharacterized protein n=1 Tax=Synaphobranchus kaupii TaxID=118154 RepID=A0A9Q1IZ77_SYNKA|nr:hypothetical protein SKAU_G00153720 [Synaphobranchus kaupii]
MNEERRSANESIVTASAWPVRRFGWLGWTHGLGIITSASPGFGLQIKRGLAKVGLPERRSCFTEIDPNNLNPGDTLLKVFSYNRLGSPASAEDQQQSGSVQPTAQIGHFLLMNIDVRAEEELLPISRAGLSH